MTSLHSGKLGRFLMRGRCFLHKARRSGLNSEYGKNPMRGGGGCVVKGTARRVIVVKSPDEKIFEEAIFIIREDAFAQRGVSASMLMDEAREIAGSFAKRKGFFRRLFSRFSAGAIAACGAAATGIAWLAVKLLV